MSTLTAVTTPDASPANARPGRANLRPPWPKGFCPNPGGKGSLYHETQALARQAAPAAMRRLIELIDDPDPRVATIASNAVLDRAFGKPKEAKPEDQERAPPVLDTSKLTLEQKKMLLEVFRSAVVQEAGE